MFEQRTEQQLIIHFLCANSDHLKNNYHINGRGYVFFDFIRVTLFIGILELQVRDDEIVNPIFQLHVIRRRVGKAFT